ncbi:hypothetical protein M2140_000260 [Clostridiales Family XIII bacterium PM5-7]
MKTRMKRITVICLAAIMALGTTISSAASVGTITSTNGAKAKVQVDWNERYTYAQLEKQLKDMKKNYSKLSKLTSIGTSHEGRKLYCMAISDYSVAKSKKTEVTVFGNIHGGERESASSAMYSAWYLLENSQTPAVKKMLKEYIVYVIPVINPDGYEQSFTWNTRQNMKPTDRDGDGVPFSDTYKDIDGDGFIATLSAVDAANKVTGSAGYESDDANKDGILANDPKASKIDMNRTFDYMWGEDGVMDTEGEAAATEPEVQAVQNFIKKHPKMTCLATLHTGIQCVLYPWGYRKAYKDLDDLKDIEYMGKTAKEMTEVMSKATQRNFYYKQSYTDYQTYSELIDYAYGKFGIHSYTIEVYRGGSNNSAYDPNRDLTSDQGCSWNNTLPAVKEVYYTHDEAVALLKEAGVDPDKLQVKDATTKEYRPWGATEGLLFKTSSTAQMVNKAPEGQDVMVEGVMQGLLKMFKNEKAVNTIKVSPKATATKGKVKISWKKPTGQITGYQIQKSKSATKGFVKVAKTKNLSYTNAKNLKKGVKYYYRVRPYSVVNGKTTYGQWTKTSVVAK